VKKLPKIGLVFSSFCDVETIEIRANNISLYVRMDENQIKQNIKALEEVLESVNKPESKIRVVK
jgi:hypothetical protein